MYHPLEPRRRPTAPRTCPIIHLYASRSSNSTCFNSSLNSVSAMSLIADMLINDIIYDRIVNLAHDWHNYFLLSFKWPSCFDQASIKPIKTKGISIMYIWLLMYIDIEYNYCAWNSIRIIEGSNNRGSYNQGSTVCAWSMTDYAVHSVILLSCCFGLLQVFPSLGIL